MSGTMRMETRLKNAALAKEKAELGLKIGHIISDLMDERKINSRDLGVSLGFKTYGFQCSKIDRIIKGEVRINYHSKACTKNTLPTLKTLSNYFSIDYNHLLKGERLDIKKNVYQQELFKAEKDKPIFKVKSDGFDDYYVDYMSKKSCETALKHTERILDELVSKIEIYRTIKHVLTFRIYELDNVKEKESVENGKC